jgi:hypothetical protein
MPISRAIPAIANASIPQSRNAMVSGVPSNDDIMILSKTASSGRGASSSTMGKPGESRRNQGLTSSGVATCCHAMAVRSCVRPARLLGSDMWRVKNTR